MNRSQELLRIINESNTESDLKVKISKILHNGITDKGLEVVIRNILFNPDNKIDWNAALKSIEKNMPEYSV